MYKSKLQELCHKKDWDLPVYSTAKDGPDHCPNFTATVKVQGQIFESPANVRKSSKEAQNLAAKIAFDYLDSVNYGVVSAPVSAADIKPPSPTALPSPGFLERGNNKKLKQNQVENDQNSLTDHSLTSYRAHVAPKDLHVYKNRLQHYAQKNNLNLPEYSCEIDGPPHARRFRASVTIGGRTFKSPIYFSTLKDSEHAAAKEAFQSLSVGEVQEDEGLYKTLLQELAQKKGLRFPSYTTITIGPPNKATFVSTVEIGGESFEGRECKTKKLSEMNAAKNAYNGLMERGENGKGNTVIRGGSSQPINNHESRGVDVASQTHAELVAAGIGEIHSDYGVISSGDVKNKAPGASSPSNLSLNSVTTCDLQQDIQRIYVPSANENDAKAKECSKHGFEESLAEKPDRAGTCVSKIVINPHKSGMKFPADATVLPYSDGNWVAWERRKSYEGQ